MKTLMISKCFCRSLIYKLINSIFIHFSFLFWKISNAWHPHHSHHQLLPLPIFLLFYSIHSKTDNDIRIKFQFISYRCHFIQFLFLFHPITAVRFKPCAVFHFNSEYRLPFLFTYNYVRSVFFRIFLFFFLFPFHSIGIVIFFFSLVYRM